MRKRILSRNHLVKVKKKEENTGSLDANQNQLLNSIDFMQHPYLYQQSVSKRITGDEEVTPLLMIANQYLVPAAKSMLALGPDMDIACEFLLRDGFVDRLVAVSSSPAATKKIKKREKKSSQSDRIEIVDTDFLQKDPLQRKFDVIYAPAAISFFESAEKMLIFFHQRLKPSGILILDEYVGPKDQEYEPAVLDALNSINQCLEPRLRHDVLQVGLRDEIAPASKSIRKNKTSTTNNKSEEILRFTYQYFDIDFRQDYGGTLMRALFSGILPNFNFDDDRDKTVANLIIHLEDSLFQRGEIPSYHTLIVGKKRKTPRAAMSTSDAKRINYSDWPGFAKYGEKTRIPTIEKFIPKNYSDNNWNHGIGKFNVAVVLLPHSKRAVSNFKVGTSVRFRGGYERKVTSAKVDNDSLIVYFSGTQLDPRTAGFPNKITIV